MTEQAAAFTTRVVLSRLVQADAEELIHANAASRAYHAPWVEPFADRAGFDAWFGRTLSGPNVALVAREASSGRVAGVVNLNEVVAGVFQSTYLGYYGAAAMAGQGLMAEAVRLAAGYAFGALGLHRLEANIQPGNARSVALVRRLGFRLEGYSPRYLRIGGEWRDHERWALLADDPRPESPIHSADPGNDSA